MPPTFGGLRFMPRWEKNGLTDCVPAEDAMTDFAAARRHMVDGQVRTQDVTDLRITTAMLDVPRERFVPPEKAGLAYLDLDVPLSAAPATRRLLKPMVLAKLIQEASPAGNERVLDVACGTGYSSAVLAELAAEVIALDDDAALTRQAENNLAGRAKVVTGPLVAGWPADAPYNVILINGAVEVVPQTLLSQLADGGRLVCVVGGALPGRATLYVRSGGEVGRRPLFDATAPLLPAFAKAPAFVF
jgi:protein-L-isoaspartate(D-aspartate) O-methyltransferase